MDNELCKLVGGLLLNKIKDEGDNESFRKNNTLFEKSQKTDPAAKEEIVNEQIELLGSELLYQRINNNFLEHKFDKFFAKEQFKLFTWRQKFFSSKFGIMTFHDVFHITKNFKEITALVCSTDYIPQNCSFTSKFFAAFGKFFENDNKLSSAAKAMFDPRPLSSRSCSIDTNELQNSGVNFKDVAHMIMALHRIGPCMALSTTYPRNSRKRRSRVFTVTM